MNIDKENMEPTDIRSLLDNINRMLESYKYLNTPVSRKSIAIALAMEALYLSVKIEFMARRWKYLLPFKEACDVDWSYWEERTHNMIGYFGDGDMGKIGQEPGFSVSAFFTLDLFELYLQAANGSSENIWYEYDEVGDCLGASEILQSLLYSGDYMDRVNEMMTLSCQKALVDDMTKNIDPDSKDASLREKIDKFVTAYTSKYDGYLTEDNLCVIGLTRLNIQIMHAYQAVDGHLEDVQFIKLYKMFTLKHCWENMQNVYNDVVSWRKTCPYNLVTKQVDKKLKAFRERIEESRWSDEIESFLDLDEPKRIDEVNAGKFMFRNRAGLTEGELNDIFDLCLSCVIW